MKRTLILGLFLTLLSQLQVQAQEPNDCVNAVVVCGNGSFMSNASGIGNIQEVSGCGGFEHNSIWLEINIVQSGTLGFDLIPNDPDIMVDYDFWVYGPNRICSNLGSPIRCATTNPNAAGLPNNLTGINGSTTLTQTGPGSNGNGYVYWLNVLAGQTYYIAIDRPVGDGGFEIQWTGTATQGSGAFPSPPTANQIDDVMQCSSNPNVSIFDLNGLKSSINSNPGNTIDFYATLADAVDDINELPGIYANATNPQTIYAKVKSAATDCYTLIDFDLIVTPIPDAALSVSSSSICEGDDVTFTITGTPGATINYTIDGGLIQQVLLDATGVTTVIESPTTNITFDLENAQILNNSGAIVCSQSLTETETVTVSSNTMPTITSNSPICEGEDGELQFTGGDPNAIIIYTIDGGATLNLNLDVTGNYTLTIPTLTTNTDIVIISVTGPTPPNCVLAINTTQTFIVSTADDASFTMTPSCDGATATVTGTTGGTFAFNPVPTDTAVIDAATGTVTGGTSGASYTIEYTTSGTCPSNSTQAFTVIPVDVASFTMTPTCDGGTATITGTVGGTFAFNPVPIDTAVINSTTGTVTGGTSAANYTIEYTTNGTCPAISTQGVTVLTSDDATFTLTATCDGGTATITGTAGGTFTFNPEPTDAATIDAATGTVTGGTAGASYTILYTTPGVCPTSSSQVLNVLPVDNSGFTMTPTCDGATATVSGVLGGTFSFNPAPTDTAVINSVTGTVTAGTSGASYTVQYTTNGTCPSSSLVAFTVYSWPVVINPTPLEVCDDNIPDGLTSIDLSIKSNEVTGSNPSYSVSYYLNQADADLGLNMLPIPYTNTSNPQTIYIRVENINTGCYDTTTLDLQVEQAPTANTPTPLLYCDFDSDGYGVFDLESKNDEITSSNPSLTVSYYETMADADNNVNALLSPYNNIVVNQQTIYVRVESSTIATDCSTIVTLQIVVNPTPQLGNNAPTPLEVCDDITGDGFAQFDLTSKEVEILQNLADPTLYTVSFYETQANADAPANQIANPTNYTNTTAFNQIIWVRVEDINPATGCYKLTSFELIVNTLPVLTQPLPLELCDVNNSGDEMETFMLDDATNEILNGQTGIGLTYFETQADADNNINPITSIYTNTINPQTVYIRATDNITGCINTVTLLLRVNPLPSPTTPSDLEQCDEDNDGFAIFDLETRTLEIIGGELDVAITYHETQEDAETGSNALVNPYTNIAINQQTIYIRATNTITGCFNATETLTIRVLESPEIPLNLEDYVVCDTDADGFAQFDLTTKNAEIIGTQSDMTLTYHITLADALSGNNQIVNVVNYTNTSNPQTIYVRLVSDNNGCIDTGFFEIRVELPPVAVQPTQLQLCDDDIDDGITVFDLTVKDNEITGGDASWSVSYYETLADAQAQINPVNAEAYTNTSVLGLPANPQTLYAVVTDTDTGCTDLVTLTIRVLPNPTPTEVLPDIILCDDINTGDMVESFDLTTNEILLLNGELGVTPTYHETLADAESGINPIVDPTIYTNTSTPQIIYVRVTNNITGCLTLVDFNIIVNPLPDVIAVTDFIICELNNDGFYNFDLTLKDTEVLNGQDPTLFTVTYHATQQDADDLMNALVSPYTNITNPQQIFVAITNNTTGCSISTPSFNVEVQEAAEANSDLVAIVFEICDDEMDDDNDLTNNSAQFDLTLQDASILDGQNPANYIISYYASEVDAELGVNPLPFLYENIVNPQVIWARVDNDTPDINGLDTSICYAITPLTLQVNPQPVFDLDDNYTLCIDTNGSEVLNSPILDTRLNTPDFSFVWFLNGTEISGATEGSYMPTQDGTYSVTITDISTSTVTMCESSDTTEVIVSAPPTVIATVTTEAFAETHIIEVTVDGPGDYEFSLDNGPWQNEPVFVDVSIGEHIVTARDKNGCGEASDEVIVMDYPLFFTPNGDGYHDTWNIAGIADQPSAKIYIFDRYGKLLKQLSPSGEGWNGTFNGELMPTNDYWFTVEYNEPNTGNLKEFKAHFTLKR